MVEVVGCVAEVIVVCGLHLHVQCNLTFDVLVIHLQLQRLVLVIGYFLEHVIAGTIVVQFEALHNLTHQRRRAQHVYFIFERQRAVVHAHAVQHGVHVAAAIRCTVAVVVAHQYGTAGRIALWL